MPRFSVVSVPDNSSRTPGGRNLQYTRSSPETIFSNVPNARLLEDGVGGRLEELVALSSLLLGLPAPSFRPLAGRRRRRASRR